MIANRIGSCVYGTNVYGGNTYVRKFSQVLRRVGNIWMYLGEIVCVGKIQLQTATTYEHNVEVFVV